IASNTLFSRLSFNGNFPSPLSSTSRQSREIIECAFIRQEHTTGWSTADLLKNHPVALRSFATFPCLAKIWVLNLKDHCTQEHGLEVYNWNDVAVHSFLTALCEM
ncbi:uncharacterized protein PHACADRAFT_109035, partial [Phanerochaete carnosa HHB-10118-sp]